MHFNLLIKLFRALVVLKVGFLTILMDEVKMHFSKQGSLGSDYKILHVLFNTTFWKTKKHSLLPQ